MARRFPALDRLIPRILTDQQFYLITDLLPIMNEVACFSSAHHVGPLVFENGDNRFRIAALVVILSSAIDQKSLLTRSNSLFTWSLMRPAHST